MFSAKEKSRAVELYKSGWTLRQCADYIGCSYGSVVLWVKQENYPRRSRGTSAKYSAETRTKAIEMIRSGVSYRKTARIIGCSLCAVKTWERAAERTSDEDRKEMGN